VALDTRVSELINKLFSSSDRLNRTGFLHSLLVLIVASIGIDLILDYLLSSQHLLSVGYLVAQRVLEFLYLAAWTPFIIRRLHDIGLSGKWVIACYLSSLLDQRLLLLIEVISGIHIVAPVNLLMSFDLMVPAFALLLLLKPGETVANRWGEPPD
jgi:uncharacterized membrane protein YhaH (DUF805 family)